MLAMLPGKERSAREYGELFIVRQNAHDRGAADALAAAGGWSRKKMVDHEWLVTRRFDRQQGPSPR